ncbi:hypothetical protein ES708_31928 [subsurface metagenome]
MRKALVAAIVIFMLAIVCLAFIGIFGRFPDEWEWVGIVLAGVGIAMVTPSILQMFWGRALIETEFEVSARESERSLVVLLKNPPVKSRVLKALGVKRETVQSLTAEIRISEFGSKEIIVPIRHARLFSDEDTSDEGSNRIVLPPTYSVAASIVIAMWDHKNKKAVILGDRLRQPLLLEDGYYYVQIIIFVDGEPKEISRQFVVGKNADDLIWVKTP